MSGLTVRIDHSSRVPVVTVAGDIDHDSWPTLAATLANVVHAGNEKAVVDLSHVEFMDSSALKAFAAGEGCELIVRNAPPMGQRILDLDEALRHLGTSTRG